ncbi:PhzF family phenazine biosynthesis protein [Streptomyces sp. R28]|uniref:PhzF family phenazine biosynthesis protein n=1 Tax=Streptomyces sp. R28 TaxID=3238628 RepID=A0AB39PZV0_9ACTN
MEVLRYVAFAADPAGGNPAGVVLDATGIDEATMLATAGDVGYSETAFVLPSADGTLDIRYFSPLTEVPFCGHATIATAVAYADRHGPGPLRLRTKAGSVSVSTTLDADGSLVASLVSVEPRTAPISPDDLAELLTALHWPAGDLDPTLPPRAAYAGAWHPVIAAADRGRLADLDYDMPSLATLMARKDWATVDLVWRESATVFHARNPFPPGGVFEDPATGAAAAALGGYLRELRLVPTPATITVHQGADMGRPSKISVSVPQKPGSGIEVTGTAARI